MSIGFQATVKYVNIHQCNILDNQENCRYTIFFVEGSNKWDAHENGFFHGKTTRHDSESEALRHCLVEMVMLDV